jgi:hypothetical protein
MRHAGGPKYDRTIVGFKANPRSGQWSTYRILNGRVCNYFTNEMLKVYNGGQWNQSDSSFWEGETLADELRKNLTDGKLTDPATLQQREAERQAQIQAETQRMADEYGGRAD